MKDCTESAEVAEEEKPKSTVRSDCATKRETPRGETQDPGRKPNLGHPDKDNRKPCGTQEKPKTQAHTPCLGQPPFIKAPFIGLPFNKGEFSTGAADFYLR
jgi:hypothetical protein